MEWHSPLARDALLQFRRVTQRIRGHFDQALVLTVAENRSHRKDMFEHGILQVALSAMDFIDCGFDPLRVASIRNDRTGQLAVPVTDARHHFVSARGELFLARLQRFFLRRRQTEARVNPIMIISRAGGVMTRKEPDNEIAGSSRCHRDQQDEEPEAQPMFHRPKSMYVEGRVGESWENTLR